MEAALQQLPSMAAGALLLPPSFKHHDAAAAPTDMQACLQPPAVPGGNSGGREQCPRCASHDTKFCYYNNYNTSQPRHFCRACRRYWTLGGSLRNIPIGGSTRKRPRPPVRRPPVHFAAAAPPARHHHAPLPPPPPTTTSQQAGLLGSLFALGAAPLLEGSVGVGFDLGLGLPGPGHHVVTGGAAGEVAAGLHGLGLPGPGHHVVTGGAAGEVAAGLHGLGLGPRRGGGPAAVTTTSTPLLWPTGLLDSACNNVETWKLAAGGGAAMWPEFNAAAAAASQVGGLMHGGAQQPQLL